MFKNILIILIIIWAGVGLYYLGAKNAQRNNGDAVVSVTPGLEEEIVSFEDCVNAGYPVMESYPRQCSSGGNTFTENIGNANEKADLITVENPLPNQTITSPFRVDGEARGSWFFEASFPVYLYDEAGNELASGIAQAEGNWMTTEFVPFSVTLEYDKPITEPGELVLEKSNASGLPEHDDELIIPLKLR